MVLKYKGTTPSQMAVQQHRGQYMSNNITHGIVDYTVPDGTPVPIGDTSGATAIAQWLGCDIQYSTSTIDEWLNIFSAVAAGKEPGGYKGTGNAYSVFATGPLVLLVCEYVDSLKVCLNTRQVSTALENYRKFLNSDYKSAAFHPTPFEVDCLAEEDEAQEYYEEHGGIMV